MLTDSDTVMKRIYIVTAIGLALMSVHTVLLYHAPSPLVNRTETEHSFAMITLFAPIFCGLYSIVYAFVFASRRNWLGCLKASTCGIVLLAIHLCVFFVALIIKTGGAV